MEFIRSELKVREANKSHYGPLRTDNTRLIQGSSHHTAPNNVIRKLAENVVENAR